MDVNNVTPIELDSGKLDAEVIQAIRMAKNDGKISGVLVSVIIGGLGLIEIALDRDRWFDEADRQKYNAWFNQHFKQAGVTISSQNDELKFSQTINSAFPKSVFDDLVKLKNDLCASIDKNYNLRASRKGDAHLVTKRKSFTEPEKNKLMDNVIIAMANQEGLDYDPETQKFSIF